MLGYVIGQGEGTADRLLVAVAYALQTQGLRVGGAVQVNEDRADAGPCHMDLHVLAQGAVVRISQNLGALAKGCRLDPAGLERAVGLVMAAVEEDPAPQVVLVNKFGKQEIVVVFHLRLRRAKRAFPIPQLKAITAQMGLPSI